MLIERACDVIILYLLQVNADRLRRNEMSNDGKSVSVVARGLRVSEEDLTLSLIGYSIGSK